MELPLFFKDDSDSMKYEEVIDFYMSWTIRCADKIYKSEFPVINLSANLILSRLMFDKDEKGQFLKDKIVSNVKVWKQHKNIDLWVELEIEEKKYALIIEHKMYSKIQPQQLERYKEIAIEYYEDKVSFEIIYIFLRPDYEIDKLKGESKQCIACGYRYLNLEQLQDTLPSVKTGNDLFDEFWYNWK